MAEERLVEVVDVEDEHAGAVHVRAEVLRVQITLNPHARGAVVRPPVLAIGHVRVEHAGAAAVEGERVGGHLAELGPERVGVGLHEVRERVDQAVDDERLSFVLHMRGVPRGDERSTNPSSDVTAHRDTADMLDLVLPLECGGCGAPVDPVVRRLRAPTGRQARPAAPDHAPGRSRRSGLLSRSVRRVAPRGHRRGQGARPRRPDRAARRRAARPGCSAC